MIIFHYPTLASTQDTALRHIQNNPSDRFFAIYTPHQTQGKGTQNRSWYMKTGNLAVTYGLQIPAFDISGLSLMVGVLVKQVITECLGDMPLYLKWANDIYLENQKIGGILIHYDTINTMPWIRIGIGLNLYPVDSQDNHFASLSSLAKHLPPLEIWVKEIGKKLVEHIIIFQNHGFGFYRDAFLKSALYLGEPIQCTTPQGIQTGIFHDITPQGHLIIKDEDEQLSSFTSATLRPL